MFRNQYSFPDSDILFLKSKDDAEKCGVDLDSVGRPVGAQAVDQFDSQPFLMAENGFRKNDISILMSAQSDDLKRSIVARLQEIQTNFPDQNLSDSELAMMAVPRCCQSASDLRDWYASLENSGLAKAVDAYVEANKPKVDSSKIDFTETNSE